MKGPIASWRLANSRMVLYWFHALALQAFLFSVSSGVVTLTSNAQSAVCPGEEVTLTCTLTEGVSLEWNSPAFNPEIRYLDNSPVGIPTQRGIFTATLISSIPTPTPSLFDFTSTLRVTATPDPDAMLNGTVITCTDQLNPMSTTLTIAGPPSPPTNVTPPNQVYGRSNVSILLQWDPPVDSGGTSVDNYTITVTGPNMQELTSNGTTATITVVYNEMYTVNIRARNCAGSSGSAIANIFEAGCGEPSTPINGSVLQFESAEVGAEVTYQCRTGFIPAAPQVSICAQNRTWSPDPALLVCQEHLQANCGIPVPPDNGTIVNFTSTLEGSVVNYLCNTGFGPLGEMSAVCAANGSWSPDPADVTCREVVDCGLPVPPRNGTVENYTDTTEGSEVLYGCDVGLVPEGRMVAMCTGNGWSPNPADLYCTAGSTNVSCPCGSCSTSNAISAVVSCAVSFIIAALVGAVVHYCAVRKKSNCQKFYSLTIARKQQKQQPAPLYEDIVAQKGTVDPAHIELRENIAYGPAQN